MIKTRNRLISVGIALLLFIAAAVFIIPTATASAEGVWDGTVASTFAGGDGSETSPFQISNGAQLAHLADLVNGGNTVTATTFFELTDNINLGGKEWTPIGKESYTFKGQFNGNGHTISNFTINKPNEDYIGLFGYSEGTIMKLAVNSGNVKGERYVGGICGQNEGTISCCSFDGTVSGYTFVGGICGKNEKSGEISNCFNSGNINGTVSVGGICGFQMGRGLLISYCISVGTVTGDGYVGGVLGENEGEATITNCYYDYEVCKVPDDYAVGETENDPETAKVNFAATAALCYGNETDMVAFTSSGLWEAGSVPADNEAKVVDGRFGKKTSTYIHLKDIGTPKSVDLPVYNFSTDARGAADWQTYVLVSSTTEFKKIADDLSRNYVLMNDIDFGGNSIEPIGNKTTPFTGKFSGENHTISNFKIDKSSDDDIGLFGYTSDTSVIMNLAVEGGVVNGSSYVGGICGLNKGTIYCCSFDGEVSGRSFVGGICGEDDSIIDNCFNSGNIKGNSHVGGICGRLYSGSISYCISVGKIESTGTLCIGGVLGSRNTSNSPTIVYCYYDYEVCKVPNDVAVGSTTSNTVSTVNAANTEALCYGDETSMEVFTNSGLWEAGIVPGDDGVGNIKDRFGTKTYTYIHLKDIGTAKTRDVGVYNFSEYIDIPEWKTYVPITEFQEITDMSRNYVLMNDINGEEITPIGTASAPFYGYFSGDGHTISNFTINSVGDNVGLFGYMHNKGVIMNLGVVDALVNGGSNVGAICGYSEGYIVNCYVFADVEASGNYAGGICGQNSGSTIRNCYFVGTVKGTNKVSPIASGGGSVDKCYYNKDLFTGSVINNGTGLNTESMTNNDALRFFMSGFGSFLTIKSNDKGANGSGTAYYPIFPNTKVTPSVDYEAALTFTTANTNITYGDDIVFDGSMKISFDNGGYTYYINTAQYAITIDNKSVVDSITTNADYQTFSAIYKPTKAGEITFTLVYDNPNCAFVDGKLTKDLTVNIARKTLTADDFNFSIMSSNLVFDGKPKSALVMPKSGIDGMGNQIDVKYFDSEGNGVTSAINAGKYTMKIDVSEGVGYEAASNLTSEDWTFTIKKASSLTIPNINLSYKWAANKDIMIIVGIPDNAGAVNDVSSTLSNESTIEVDFTGNYTANGEFTLHVGPNTAADIGKKRTINVELVTGNYESVTFSIIVTLTDRDDQAAPDSTAFDVTFTNDDGELRAVINTELEGVEYSFDGGITWSDVNTAAVAHNEEVTVCIRYKETDEMNASAAVPKTVNSGHGTLIHHEAAQATCQSEGNTEYWECAACAKYYSDEAATTEVALADTILAKADHKWEVKYTYDKDGHWHKCENCDAVTAAESHVSSGEATETTDEYCTVCGYVITPKKVVKDNQTAPDPAAFDVIFTNDGSNLKATIKTALTGVEYSFDGTTWSSENTTTVAHLVDVTAYIRYAETDELNFSETVFKTVNSGHGTLIHHEAVQATCRHDGSTEYWECAACAKFYSDEAATTEVALADTILAKTDHKWAVKYAYNKDSHWHKCEYCDATTEAESHVSSGEATTKTAEYCTVCGYIITPKKGGGSSGGHVSSGVHNRDNTTETNPAINGTQKTWTDIAADLDKQGGGSATISMNGETKIPADVIKAIADKKIKVEFVYDGTKSWLVDGAKITAVSAVDFSLLPGSVDAGSLRGVSGGKYRISANIPADLKFAFQKQYAGEFVNVYKLVDGELVFRTCAKLAEDGTAVISGMDAAGEYAVMVCRYSDRQGDVDNNGVLDIADALALLRYSVGVDSGESLQLIDFNGDGKVDMADARTVLRWSFGLSA